MEVPKPRVPDKATQPELIKKDGSPGFTQEVKNDNSTIVIDPKSSIKPENFDPDVDTSVWDYTNH